MGIREILNDREGAGTSDEYEIISGRGRMKMVTFLKRDGSIHCANYSYLHGVGGGANEIRLDFARYMVVIKGANLQQIHQGLADHRVTFLRESDPDRLLPNDRVRIDQILILHGKRGDEPPSRSGTSALPGFQRERWKEIPRRLNRRLINTICSDARYRPLARGAAS